MENFEIYLLFGIFFAKILFTALALGILKLSNKIIHLALFVQEFGTFAIAKTWQHWSGLFDC